MTIDQKRMERLLVAAGLPASSEGVGGSGAWAIFAAGVIEECAATLHCMSLQEEFDAIAEAYNIAINDGVEALRMSAAMLRSPVVR